MAVLLQYHLCSSMNKHLHNNQLIPRKPQCQLFRKRRSVTPRIPTFLTPGRASVDRHTVCGRSCGIELKAAMVWSVETEAMGDGVGVGGRRKVDDMGTDEEQSSGRRTNQTVIVLLQQWTSQISACVFVPQ